MSSGATTLHISSVFLGGANAGDYSMTNGCTASAYSVGATCSISLMFAPSTAGQRTATITLTDNAPDSPQVINIAGSVNPAFTVGVAPGGSLSASVTAGQVAQYQLQLTPGPGYNGSVSLACSGAPFGATCQVPSSVPVANGAPSPFTVSVATSGTAMAPISGAPRFGPPLGMRVLPLLMFWLIFLKMIQRKRAGRWTTLLGRAAFASMLAAILIAGVFHATGCGGGTTATALPVIQTPQGSSTLAVTPSAMSLSGKPLQLQPIQLTLTVN